AILDHDVLPDLVLQLAGEGPSDRVRGPSGSEPDQHPDRLRRVFIGRVRRRRPDANRQAKRRQEECSELHVVSSRTKTNLAASFDERMNGHSDSVLADIESVKA